MPSPVLNRAYFRDLFRKKEADEFLIEHPKSGMLMILVPAGKFLTDTDGGAPFEVDLPSFYLAIHPVTYEQYSKFLCETKHLPPAIGGDWNNQKPLTNVRWDDAMAYCNWAGLRLPTELEWEKAARGLDGREYPWGEHWTKQYNNNCTDRSLSNVWSHPRGGAPFGGLQMSGNVWEWCADFYDEKAYIRYRQGNIDPIVSGKYHVLRGGAWCNGKSELSNSYRDYDCYPEGRRVLYGFRCALSINVS